MFIGQYLFAQKINNENYLPLVVDTNAFKIYIDSIEGQLSKDLITIQNKVYSSKIAKEEVQNIYKGRKKRLQNQLLNGQFYSDTLIVNYFNNILKEILTANNLNHQLSSIRLLVSRSTVPNAYCMGEGTIVFNIALFRYVKNESQIAAVLCHELAHFYLDHVNKELEKNLNRLYSEEMQKELNKIAKSDYGKYKKTIELAKTFVFNDSKHSRIGEAAADSLGFILLKNTRYQESEMISLLGILDSIDQEKYIYPLNLKTLFSFQDFPFQDNWLKKETLLLGFSKIESDKDKAIADSLKTHPDCIKRIALLKPFLKSNSGKKQFLQPEERFKKLLSISDFEMVETNCFFENYGQSLYIALKLLNIYPDNLYLKSKIGQSFFNIQEAQKNHTLGRYVPTASDNFSEDYNELLNFIHNLRLSELQNIGFNYLLKNYNNSDNEEYLFYLVKFSKINGNIELFSSTKDRYITNYPKGKYIKAIKDI